MRVQPLSAAFCLGLVAAASAHAGPATAALTVDAVNQADATGDGSGKAASAGVLRAQILLERARFSPGEIDGLSGSNLRGAIAGFQASHDLDASGRMDAPTWKALAQDSAPALATITLTDADVAGPFRPLPAGMEARSKLDALGYTSSLEALGERFHASPALLKKLNPQASFDQAGTTLVVPDLANIAPLPAVAKLVVDKSASTVSLLDDGGKVVAQYPASTGSSHDPLPLGDWKIKGVGRNPTYHYSPALFWDSNPKDAKATLPAGPNNPVGVVWIDLSKEHYGIHGTPEPSKIGKTQSHGCIRMTNWSARTVSDAVKPGMVATLEE
ncbi:MAG TPA: L,D-transpeptidase [Dyella sp.]|nr:L,D-transpeptidase [Dyella sp.]